MIYTPQRTAEWYREQLARCMRGTVRPRNVRYHKRGLTYSASDGPSVGFFVGTDAAIREHTRMYGGDYVDLYVGFGAPAPYVVFNPIFGGEVWCMTKRAMRDVVAALDNSGECTELVFGGELGRVAEAHPGVLTSAQVDAHSLYLLLEADDREPGIQAPCSWVEVCENAEAAVHMLPEWRRGRAIVVSKWDMRSWGGPAKAYRLDWDTVDTIRWSNVVAVL